MVRIPPDGDEKPLVWIGSSRDDLMEFPGEVKADIGFALGVAQFGGEAPAAKPWRGQGPGVFEVVEDFDTDTYRAVYTVGVEGAVYVLHAFQKKSRTGRKTDRRDVDKVERRLREAQRHYQENFPRGRP